MDDQPPPLEPGDMVRIEYSTGGVHYAVLNQDLQYSPRLVTEIWRRSAYIIKGDEPDDKGYGQRWRCFRLVWSRTKDKSSGQENKEA